MTLTLTIGDRIITLIFKDGSEKNLPFYKSVYRLFLVDRKKSDTVLEIRFLPHTGQALFGVSEEEEDYKEYAVAKDSLNNWVEEYIKGGFSLTQQTIGIQSSTGRLIYSPETLNGIIYLPRLDRHPYRSLYRLFWIYFAQIVGEAGGCFLHAASLAKEGVGALLIGGSGTGKSTLARQMQHVNVMADEAPVVTNGGESLKAYPSPYHQMEFEKRFDSSLVKSGVNIKGLYFIIQDNKTFLEPVAERDAIAMIIARYIHFFPFISPEAKSKIFDLFHRACHKLPVKCLHFVKNTDVWEIISHN